MNLLIDDQIKDLTDKTICDGEKVKDLQAKKQDAKNVPKKMVVTKEKSTNLDEIESKHIIEYEIVFQ
jgi:hypothetical protein